jgi:hypothetical protein
MIFYAVKAVMKKCFGIFLGGNKFKYVPGTTYVYDYTADTLTYVRGATKEKSQLHFSATASFHVLFECDFVLQVINDHHITNYGFLKQNKFNLINKVKNKLILERV